MKVIPISPRGFCKGVVNAINIAKKHTNTPNTKILGMIVHNKYIVDALDNLGLKTIDDNNKNRLEMLDEINDGTIIFTAHGVSQEVISKAKKKNLNIVDATCNDVIKTHELIKNYLNLNYEILYIGKHGHPESEGALSIDKNHIHLITKKEDFNNLDKKLNYVITNQTTMSLYDIYDLCEYAKNNIPNLTIAQETCNATKVRQEAIKNMDSSIDIVFIVGDPNSNNTKKLAKIAKTLPNKEVHMIETVKDIDILWLKNKKVAGVSSGASTPTYLTKQVIKFLEQFDYHNSHTYQKPEINIKEIL